MTAGGMAGFLGGMPTSRHLQCQLHRLTFQSQTQTHVKQPQFKGSVKFLYGWVIHTVYISSTYSLETDISKDKEEMIWFPTIVQNVSSIRTVSELKFVACCIHLISVFNENNIFVGSKTAPVTRITRKKVTLFKYMYATCYFMLTCLGYPFQHSLWSQNHGV